MTSEIAVAPQVLPSTDSMDTSSQEASFEAPTVNGHHTNTTNGIEQDNSSIQDAPAEAQPAPEETAIDTKVATSTTTDLPPAGPTPIENIASGIQPIADFIPKDASNLSHPTPPPDEPLISGAADIDVEMDDAEGSTQPSAELEPESVPVQAEPSLVRPREDDFEDEPAAKRSKVEVETQADVDAPASSHDAPMADQPIEEAAPSVGEAVAEPRVEPVEESNSEPVEKSADEPMVEPSSADVKVETTQSEVEEAKQPSDAPGESVESTEPSAQSTASPIEEKPAAPTTATDTQLPSEAAAVPDGKPKYSTQPMTKVQKNSLLEKMKNLKKTKNSVAFLKPVDPAALNIPHYLDIIKQPMDLGTMEGKLKRDEYASVQDFANDFDLIVNNSRRFNGEAHAVTVAAVNMEAYFKKMMETVPTTDMAEPPKVQRKRSLSIPREKPLRRESRVAAPPAPVAAPTETYALQADGTPQIRRQSSIARPTRAIKPPANREIPYAKPKRKEHQLELKFCEHVLKEIRSPRYGHFNHVFQAPVDPVALNIPHYHQVIKTPMDLGTMADKLRNGQYGTATEFRKDFELVIANCKSFNPLGNPVRDLGIGLEREFQTLWNGKNKWERQNQPASNRASSASADDESGADEDDEDDEDPEDDKTATILALQKQLAEMQNAMAGLAGSAGSKSGKSKKAKPSKNSTKRADAPTKTKAPPKPTSKPKKTKLVNYEEKQEISEAVARMDEKQVAKLTEIITQNCAKYRDMDEMELEIDDLPNDVQLMLLDYVRKIFGNPKKKARDPSPDDAAALDDDDFEPEKGARGNKRKKHRPMGKKEQQDTIDKIQSKLAQFSQAATSGSESPNTPSFNTGNAQVDTSGDEESEESEEE